MKVDGHHWSGNKASFGEDDHYFEGYMDHPCVGGKYIQRCGHTGLKCQRASQATHVGVSC